MFSLAFTVSPGKCDVIMICCHLHVFGIFLCSFEMSCENIAYWSYLFRVLNTSCSWMPTCHLEKLTVFEEMFFFMHLVFLVCSYKPFMPSRAYCIWSKYLVYGFLFTHVLSPYKLTYLYFYKSLYFEVVIVKQTIKEGQKFYI